MAATTTPPADDAVGQDRPLVPTTTLPTHPTAEAHRRLTDRDPALVAGLRAGDPEAVAVAVRALRLVPLPILAATPGPVVEALALLPQIEPGLRATWGAQDRAQAARLLGWAAGLRSRGARGASGESS